MRLALAMILCVGVLVVSAVPVKREAVAKKLVEPNISAAALLPFNAKAAHFYRTPTLCEACAASLLRCRLAPEEQVHAPALRLCAAATPGPREHFETDVPFSLQPLTLLPSDLDGRTHKEVERAPM